MLEIIYSKFIFKYSRIFLFFILLITVFLGYKAFSLKIDASSDTLVLENDKDLTYHQLDMDRVLLLLGPKRRRKKGRNMNI